MVLFCAPMQLIELIQSFKCYIQLNTKIYFMKSHSTEYLTYEEFLYHYHVQLGTLTREAKHEMAQRGEWPGPAPLGYLNHRTGKYETTIIVDSEKAPLVREAFEKAAQGNCSLRVLLAELTAKGLRSRNEKCLQVAGLWHLLVNPFYAGFIRYEGELFPGQHEPLTDQKTFERVKCQLEKRRKNRDLNATKRKNGQVGFNPHLEGKIFSGYEMGGREAELEQPVPNQ